MLIDRLLDRVKGLGSPVCVGLDPNIDRIPVEIITAAQSKHGESLRAELAAILKFNIDVLESIEGLAAVVKPQIAYYEKYGSAGFEVFSKTCDIAKSMGYYVIADSKRGDIGPTSLAYAQAFMNRQLAATADHVAQPAQAVQAAQMAGLPEDFGIPNEHYGGGIYSDFVTVNPYLGTDCLDEFVGLADKNDRGIFVLVKTSNPSSSQLQDLELKDGGMVFERAAKITENYSKDRAGKYGYSAIGAVVGATHRKELAYLRKLMPTSLFLVPGYGAQGAAAADIVSAFGSGALGALINSSRGIIYAQTEGATYRESIRTAAQAMLTDIIDALEAAGER